MRNRIQEGRNILRTVGLRPLQIWVPDTCRPDFAQECHRQALLVATADAADPELSGLLDAALDDLDDAGE